LFIGIPYETHLQYSSHVFIAFQWDHCGRFQDQTAGVSKNLEPQTPVFLIMNISIYLTKLAILLCDNSSLKKNLGCGYCMVREMEVAGWCQQRFPKYDENKEHSELIVYFPDLA
jgi:hypothetical protein